MSAPTKQDTALERALALAAQGFHVFPSWTKQRHITGWPTRATRDAAQVRAWFSGPYKDCWPSIYAGKYGDGQALVIIDVDPRGIPAIASGELDDVLLDTRMHKTPRGGFHSFYVVPSPGVKSATNVLADGIDIRSKGGLVHFGEGYSVAQGTEIAQAPASLVAKCGDLAPVTSPADRAQDRIAADQEAALQRAEDVMRTWPKVAEGDRNTALRDFIYRVRETCATDGDSTLAIGLSFAAEVCIPPYPENEARATIASAIKSAQNAAGQRVALPEDFPVVESSAPAAKSNITMMWAGDIVIPEVWNDPYLIKGLLHAGDDAQLFGETNLGKTFIALNMGVHIAKGMPWMRQKTAPNGVLLLAYEGLRAMPLRLAALRRQFPTDDWGPSPLAVVAMNAPLVDERTVRQEELPGRRRLQEVLGAFKAVVGTPPGLIIVDTYSKAIGGSVSDEGLATKFASMTQALIETYGSTVLRIHHPGHTKQDRARGSYSLRAGVDSDIQVEDGLIHTPKQRDGRKQRFGYKLETVTLGRDQDGEPVTSCIVLPAQISAHDLTERQAKVLNIITEVASGTDKAARKAVLVVAKGQGLTAHDLGHVLAELKKKSRIDYDASTIKVSERGAAGAFDED